MRKLELLLILGLTIVHFLLSSQGINGPLRVVSGFIFLTILPGYVVLAFFYRTKLQNQRLLTHLVLSIPISLALISTLGLVVNVSSIGLETIANTAWLSAFILVFAFLSYFRNPKANTHGIEINQIILVIGLLVTLFALNYSLSSGKDSSGENYLSFYMLSDEAFSENYPNWVKVGVPFEIVLGVEYRGASEQKFTLTSSDGSEINLSLAPGDAWTKLTEITVKDLGSQEVTWRLYHAGQFAPQREVRLWVTAY
jgi:uncharacterized membrane protein